jgi:hypothetical protein
MSITWEDVRGHADEGYEGAGKTRARRKAQSAGKAKNTTKTVVMQVAALGLLAIVGGTGGAAIASYAVHRDPAPAAEAPGIDPASAEPVKADAAEPEPGIAPARIEPGATVPDVGGSAEAGTMTADAAPSVRRVTDADAVPEIDPIPSVETQVAEARIDTGGRSPAPALDSQAIEVSEPPRLAAVDAPDAAAGVDAYETASILSPGEPVAVADSDEEASRLEQLMAEESAPPAADALPAASADDATAPVADDGTLLSPARAAKYVNLRASPDNEGAVLAVVPASAEILAEENCTHWCTVVHDGRRGYVYKSFIERPGAVSG